MSENFNGVTPYTLLQGDNSAGMIDIFIDNVGGENNEINDGSATENIDGTNFYLGAKFNNDSQERALKFPSLIIGFGADWKETEQFRIEIDNIKMNLPDAPGFMGFVSDTPFSRADFILRPGFLNEGYLFAMDNLSFAKVQTTPVASSTLLLSFFAALVALRRKSGN